MMEIRPKEIKEMKYWFHILIIVLIVYFLVNQFVEPMDITIKSVLLGTVFVGIADIISHTILQLE